MKLLSQKIFATEQLEEDNGSILTIDIWGDKRWKNSEGKLHRINGPAFESQASLQYHRDGQRHREDGPAVIYRGSLSYCKPEYYLNGKLIPEEYFSILTIEKANGGGEIRTWRNVKGQLHRKNGPALISFDNDAKVITTQYMQNGKLHREDGPAIISEKVQYYYLNNQFLSKEEFLLKTSK